MDSEPPVKGMPSLDEAQTEDGEESKETTDLPSTNTEGWTTVAAPGREFDLLVWGASGFTGRMVASELAGRYGPPGAFLRYGLVGRDGDRLRDVAQLMVDEGQLKITAEQIPCIVCELKEPEDVRAQTQRSRCVLALAGPYTDVGEILLLACVQTSTHYVDITGELRWVKSMWEKYDALARENRATVVPCCGFDYAPNDLSLFALHDYVHAKGLQVVEKNTVSQVFGGDYKHQASGGTMRSAMAMISRLPLWRILFCSDPFEMNSAPPSERRARRKNGDVWGASYSKSLRCWTSPNLMSAGMARYVRWSQELQKFPFGKNWIFTAKSQASGLLNAMWQVWMFVELQRMGLIFSRIRPLWKKFPKSGTGVTDAETARKGTTFIKTSASVRRNEDEKPRTAVVEMVYNKGGPYPMTATLALESAMTLALEDQEGAEGSSPSSRNLVQQPKVYGVSSPAVAMGRRLLLRLRNAGISTSVTEEEQKKGKA